MKCDSCKNQHAESASLDYPHPYVYCTKGHWDGLGYEDELDVDPWEHCTDFAEIEPPESDNARSTE